MRSNTERNSSGTTCTEIPSSFRSCWIMVAICVRWLLEALVRIENFTGDPAESIKLPSGDQENPAACKSFRACSTERAGCGMVVLIQKLLAGVTGVHSGVA